MKSVFHAFLSAPALRLYGILALCFVLWFLGPLIKFGDDNVAPFAAVSIRIFIIVVAIAIWAIYYGIKFVRVRKKAQAFNAELRQSNAVESEKSSEDAGEIQRAFDEALQKVSRKTKGRAFGKSGIYELPWYIVIGPPGSGKTTALVTSSLDFPLQDKDGARSVSGVGGTRNCDWWFTNEAVLIDTAGRYTTQDSHKVADNAAWDSFLSLLRKYRPRRPINGAILTISLLDLMVLTDEDKRQLAATLRARLDELMEKLQIRFPIYLMFTKVDMVGGFREYFDEFGKEQRDQTWGYTLTENDYLASATAKEGNKAQDKINFSVLDTELQSISRRLYDRLLPGMQRERDPRRRISVFNFPAEFEALLPSVKAFTESLFKESRFSFQPYLRGVYFTSGTQDGTPIDRLLSSVSENFGFNREQKSFAGTGGKSFFINRLLRDVIFPEAELVGSNRQYEKRLSYARIGLASLAAVALLGLGLHWASYASQQKSQLVEIRSLTAQLQDEAIWKNTRRDPRSLLKPLDALQQAAAIHDTTERPFLAGAGLYDPRVGRLSDEVYQSALLRHFQPSLVQRVEDVLQQGGDERFEGGDLYGAFQIYKMLEQPERRDEGLIKSWFADLWQADYAGQGSDRVRLLEHLDKLFTMPAQAAQLNERIETAARTELLRVPVAQRIYRRIRSMPIYRERVNFAEQFGDLVPQYFSLDSTGNSLRVRQLYTIEAYRELSFDEDSELIRDVVNERWMLARNANDKLDFVEEDFEKIGKDVKKLYLNDYLATWDAALKAIEIKPISGLAQANTALLNFSDPVYSPLLQILDIFKKHTQLTPPVAAIIETEADGSDMKSVIAKKLSSKIPETIVDQRFKDLHKLVQRGRRGTAPIDTLRDRMTRAQQYLGEFALSAEPGKQALAATKARFQGAASNPVAGLESYSATLPAPVDSWVKGISRQGWRAMVSAGGAHLRSEWRAEVYAPWQQALADRYPFSNSPNVAPLDDFTAFFKPDGTVDSFFKTQLMPFVNTKGNWSNKSAGGFSLGLSRKTLDQLRRFKTIQATYFKNGESPSVAFQAKPLSMSESDARFMLDLGGSRVEYRHGPKFWKPLGWSADGDNTRIRFLFDKVSGNTVERSFTGPFAWFRFLDATTQSRGQRSNELILNVGASQGSQRNSIRYQVRLPSRFSPFDKSLISNFRCPKTL